MLSNGYGGTCLAPVCGQVQRQGVPVMLLMSPFQVLQPMQTPDEYQISYSCLIAAFID